ncbi:hypothetical protein JOE38_002690 [Clavibacter michiganensis]|nr:hypothetical protein [Clavibacter michiganensis]
MPECARLQNAAPHSHGTFPGVFALPDGLRQSGRLSTEETDLIDAVDARATPHVWGHRRPDPRAPG